MGETSAATFGPPCLAHHGRILLVGLRQRHTVASDLSAVMAGVENQWVRLRPRVKEVRRAVSKDLFGVLLKVVEGDAGFEYFCGLEVAKLASLPEGFSSLVIPPLRYAVFRHTGTVDDLLKTYFDIFGKVLPEAGLTVADSKSGAPEFIERFDSQYSLETRTGGPEIMVPLSG
jgi:AraC family transcriptional regulator